MADGNAAGRFDPFLSESRDLANRWAPKLCAAEHGCQTYHHLRPLWRLLGIVTPPSAHLVFHSHGLAGLSRQSKPRILVAGSADHGLPAAVLEACLRNGVDPDITVVDRCRTPLLLCRRWAKRAGVTLGIEHADLFNYRAVQRFDTVICDLLLSQVEPQRRPGLFHHWHEVLDDGGRVVMVDRLHSQPVESAYRSSAGEQARFADNAVQRCLDRPDLGLDCEMVYRQAIDYRKTRINYPVSSVHGIRGAIDPTLFEIASMDTQDIKIKPEWHDGHDRKHPSRYLYTVLEKR